MSEGHLTKSPLFYYLCKGKILKFLVSKFVPWDLEATRTKELTATRNESTRQPARSSRGINIYPIAGCLQLSTRVALSSYVRVASKSQGTNFETKIFNFMCFLALPTETIFTTPHYYPKYEVLAIEIFLW